MKYLFVFIISFNCLADEWRTDDTKREAVYMALHVIDWAQTRNIARNPDRYFEYNSLIGSHPSVGRVDGYMATSALIHIGVTHIFQDEYRAAWQYVTIGFKARLIQHNFSIGISSQF